MSSQKQIRYLTYAALIAALYLLLTAVSYAMGLDKGMIQLRLSEALCVLVCFTPAAVPGMTVGCLLANLLTGAHLFDIVFGTLATFFGAWGGRLLARALFARAHKTNCVKAITSRSWRTALRVLLVALPTFLCNIIAVPLLLAFVYGAEAAYPLLLVTVAAGEALSAMVLGVGLYLLLSPHAQVLFGTK